MNRKFGNEGGSEGDDRGALGRAGEEAAERYLVGRGMQLLERNFRCRAGEIDLVMRDGRTLVFVEVKTRRGRFEGSEAVDTRKQGQIARAAFTFLGRLQSAGPMPAARFDVVAVDASEPSFRCRHIVDAFDSPIEY